MGRFDADRDEMIEILRRRGITDVSVLDAMAKVERHRFVDATFLSKSYDDSALPIAHQQTISQPYTVAFMTQALHVKAGDKVLEIGTGSGYQATILSCMGCRVFTIERHIDLLQNARKIFDALNLRIASKAGDGTVGWSEFAPYDGIIVTAGAPAIPESLKNQLSEGGRIVIPIGGRDLQKIVVGTKSGENLLIHEFDGFKFVPLIGKNGWNSNGTQ